MQTFSNRNIWNTKSKNQFLYSPSYFEIPNLILKHFYSVPVHIRSSLDLILYFFFGKLRGIDLSIKPTKANPQLVTRYL